MQGGEISLPVVIRQQSAGLACLGRIREGGGNREVQGIQLGRWRVLTEWYTQKSFFTRTVRNESFDAL